MEIFCAARTVPDGQKVKKMLKKKTKISFLEFWIWGCLSLRISGKLFIIYLFITRIIRFLYSCPGLCFSTPMNHNTQATCAQALIDINEIMNKILFLKF
ncbi:hypothetical protein BpHYR1_032155 [Brachionus plicatilis]|uniref:Uncharacterized protein n=1 Tax=Brachionus plicatilis TaxID=10195 RepID=A0A3M7Q8Y8_BRAPC|nr:hypothetical protein BpHYR1_032155 [Brachionus plicatilis]